MVKIYTRLVLNCTFREYNFDSRNQQTFSDEDIVNMYPIVKHISPRATDAYNFYTTGQSKIQQVDFCFFFYLSGILRDRAMDDRRLFNKFTP